VEQPLVSVVIPTKDRNREVPRAVMSALAQSVREIEVIVVDDGSTEPAQTAVRAASDDPRLVFHRNVAPTGPSAARNVGTALARGAFVAFLDSDDEWHPTKLARQIDELSRNERAGLSLCGFEVVGGHRPGRRRVQRVPRAVRAGHTVELLDTRHEPTVSSCFVLPRAVARTYLFDTDLGAFEDLDLAARISADLDIVSTRAILVRKHVSTDRQFFGPRVIDARRMLIAKHGRALERSPRVVARNEVVLAAELAGAGRPDEARTVLNSIEAGDASVPLRVARRLPARSTAQLGRILHAVRLSEKVSARGALWRLRTGRLRWET
jgi:glycosyltransferase involved in cell wall biosynthesis